MLNVFLYGPYRLFKPHYYTFLIFNPISEINITIKSLNIKLALNATPSCMNLLMMSRHQVAASFFPWGDMNVHVLHKPWYFRGII